tara:strand:- start:655 stop:1233 length:579 start_codon:yes stop_codon:yes gene_type:complete
MNNLVKFLILSFLILYPYSLSSQEEKNAQLKCHLELNNQARILLIRLDLVEMKYYAYQSKDKPMHLGDFWTGMNALFLFGENDAFYGFEGLDLWQRSMEFNGRFADFPLSILTEAVTYNALDRETLELQGLYDLNKVKSHKCTLINKEEYVNYVNEWVASFNKFLETERMFFEEEEEKKEREREEQRERFKL